MVKPPAVESVHATIAPADTLLAERHALYSLATELLCPDMGDSTLPDQLLDSPPVRFRIGEALAGRAGITLGELRRCHDTLGVTRSAHGLPVVADDRAHGPLAEVLQIVQTQPGLRLLTEGQEFEEAFWIVEEGVRLAHKLSPGLVNDLMAHVSLFAILDPDTSHGLASASSRWFPGLVLIDAPKSPIEVAEALVHEGAHQKFFDFVITRNFLGFEADTAERFTTSWSKATWPMEQTVAAWHAYTCMRRFALDAEHCELHKGSLLPVAGERATEIGQWLAEHLEYLQSDARVLLNGLMGGGIPDLCGTLPAEPLVTGCLKPNPNVRFDERAQAGRRIVAIEGTPPELLWVDPDAGQALQLICANADGLEVDELVAGLSGLWGVAPDATRARVSTGLRALIQNQLVSVS